MNQQANAVLYAIFCTSVATYFSCIMDISEYSLYSRSPSLSDSHRLFFSVPQSFSPICPRVLYVSGFISFQRGSQLQIYFCGVVKCFFLFFPLVFFHFFIHSYLGTFVWTHIKQRKMVTWKMFSSYRRY